MEKTKKCLEEAFAGESQANRKYLAFADKAEKEATPRPPGFFAPQPPLRQSMPMPIFGL